MWSLRQTDSYYYVQRSNGGRKAQNFQTGRKIQAIYPLIHCILFFRHKVTHRQNFAESEWVPNLVNNANLFSSQPCCVVIPHRQRVYVSFLRSPRV